MVTELDHRRPEYQHICYCILLVESIPGQQRVMESVRRMLLETVASAFLVLPCLPCLSSGGRNLPLYGQDHGTPLQTAQAFLIWKEVGDLCLPTTCPLLPTPSIGNWGK